MKVTIVPDDGVVVVDGVAFGNLDLSFIDQSVHAVSWDGSRGEVQVKESDGRIVRNDVIESFSGFQPAIDAWNAAYSAANTPPTLEQRRAARWEQVKAIRQTKTERGGFFAAGKWFHSDVFSRTQQLGLIIAAQQFVAGGGGVNDPIPGVPAWSTMDNSTIVLTPAVVSQFLPAFSAQEGAMFVYAKALREQIDASEDPESIDITTGWPPVYGG